ncbi:IPT/TIG domain protein [compost metagenome]
MGPDGFAATSVSPATASATAPSLLKVQGIGLATSTESFRVTLGGALCSVIAASPTGTEVTFQVPAGLPADSTFPLVLQLGPWTHQSLTVQVQ